VLSSRKARMKNEKIKNKLKEYDIGYHIIYESK
jgi:hypothetical protein